MGISERKRQFAKSRHRVEDNIDMDLKEIRWHNVEWIYPSQKRPSGGLSLHWRAQEFCPLGVQQIQLRIEDRENGDLGMVAP